MKKYLVIGNPISHSLSPELHNYWIKQNGLDAIYEKKKLNNNELENLISNIKQGNINGINVTVPFKNVVIPFLDELSDEAKITQSVNTIYLKDKKTIGHNTDIEGFKNAIKKINFDFNNKKIFILGAGGVVPSIIYASIKMGSSEILISNRTKEKAEKVKNIFDNIKLINWGEIPNFDVIINATSMGLKHEDKLNLDLTKIGKNKLFYDVIYNPSETSFLTIGKKLGNKYENGKLMFVYQAFSAFKLWHGIEPTINNETMKLLNR
ncbi:shikimate dehydrogenase [Candidatus Pelagibacter sp.]|nr:shikimate dehydrogenase [Candidatus Pelagibacter sp.]|tara:strand:- start:245 stop:1039 length:795 start_codon:yes stop_codon:yes gene_type:complete